MYQMLSGQLPFGGDREESILYSIVHEEPKPLKDIKRDIPPELKNVIDRALKKNPGSRYQTAVEMLRELRKYQDALKAEEAGFFNLRSLLKRLRKPQVAILSAIVVIAIVLFSVWFFNRQAKIRWAKETLLPKIEQLVLADGPGRNNLIDAFELVQVAEKYLVGNPQLSELASKCAASISIETDPPGARVFLKKYSAPESEWKYIGISPLKDIRLPMGIFRWKMVKDGYETLLAVSPTFKRDISRKYLLIPYNTRRVLDRKGSLPPGMVRILGGQIQDVGYLDDFFIDQYEVTNKQFKEFIDKGGYQKKEYWKHPFVKDCRTLTWEEAMEEFVDQTGRLGPSTWQAGSYPEGQENYPVSGVSWHEAAAHAESVGKSLPTGYHWGLAYGELSPMLQTKSFYSVSFPLCNFQGQGAAPVGNYKGTTAYGAEDMAGNVREWCWNESPQGRLIRGGAWNDATYMFENLTQAPSFDRSPKNGFRCALYIHPEKIPKSAFQIARIEKFPDFYKEKPVPDSVFQVYKDQFFYDKKELNAHVEQRDESAKDWVQEKITFDAAYENERLIAYLFLPKNAKPPFQTVIYFPGSGSVVQKSSQDLDKYWEFEKHISFILKDGRAAIYPIYKGTFERGNDVWPIHLGENSRLFTEYLITLVKDVSRSIDYLETRPDIDRSKIAYLGFSWGGIWGTVIPAVEERIKVSVLKVGGMFGMARPEANEINYVTRVKIPTLMLNGKYDMTFPYETAVKPMFDLLGTPKEDKVLKLYDADHYIPTNEYIKETLVWLDKYFGRPAR